MKVHGTSYLFNVKNLRKKIEKLNFWQKTLFVINKNYVKISTSTEPNSHSFWATGLILVSKEAEFCALQSHREIFSIFEFWKKLRVLECHFFLQKWIFSKKIYNSKTKMKFEKKTLCSFVEHKILLRLIQDSTV